MKLLTLFAIGSLNFFITLGNSAQAHSEIELPDLVEKVLPSVVNISSIIIQKRNVVGWDEYFRLLEIPTESKQSTLGTGFIIDAEKGLVVTNNHVVDHASEVNIVLQNKKEYRAAIVGKDPKTDLALIKIKEKAGRIPAGLKAVDFGNSEKVRIAESVFAVGNPFGLQHTVTKGIISAKNRTIGVGPFDNFLQTDASINPGNSGGPLFNFKGEVVGINTVIFSKTGQSGGLGFAIPINELKRHLPNLEKYGRVPRPWLGILAEQLTPQKAVYFQFAAREGVLIYNMVEDGPSDRAGLRSGDIILEISGKKVLNPDELERELAALSPTDMAELKVLNRGGKVKTVKVKLSEFPSNTEHLPAGLL